MRVSRFAAASNIGRKRRHNEDAYVCEPPLFAVADGMGGARAGEVASSLAAGALRETTPAPPGDDELSVVELIRAANLRVHERALVDSAASGMGTTMTVALVRDDGGVVIGHVGDSRAYLLREGRLEQLTEDHSLVAELVRRGELSPEQAEVHPQRSVITRALGPEAEVEIDAFTVQARSGDVFLLCSDGLTTMIDAAAIAELLQSSRHDLSAASRALVRAANDAGGEDNITTVLFALGDDDEDSTLPDARAAEPASPLEDEDTLHPGEVAALADPSGVDPSDTIVGLVAPAAPERGAAPAAGEAPAASRARLLAAQALAVVLAALIVLLVVKGFAL